MYTAPMHLDVLAARRSETPIMLISALTEGFQYHAKVSYAQAS
jgi:hypothetical protein